jgi:hypothetical protein
MPASPYDGLTEEELTAIKLFLLKCLSGKAFASQNVPGLSYSRRLESLESVRIELAMVNDAIDNLLGDDSQFTDRTVMKAV